MSSNASSRPASSGLCTPQQAAEYLNCSVNTLAAWRLRKPLPLPFVRLGKGKGVRYHVRDLEAFIAANTVGRSEQ